MFVMCELVEDVPQRLSLEEQRKTLECKLVIFENNFYYILLGSKLEIQGDSLFDLQISSETAVHIDKNLFDFIPRGEPINFQNTNTFSLLFHKVHNCHLQRPFYKPAPKASVLIIMTDNRPLKKMAIESSHYLALTAVINREYTKRHGYDFLIFHLNSSTLAEDVLRIYQTPIGDDVILADTPDSRKNKKIVFNSHVRQFRFAPWAKIPIFIFLVKMMKLKKLQSYDYICYIDSDAAFNPDLYLRSVSDFYNYWKDVHQLQWYEPNLQDSMKYVSDKSMWIPIGGTIKNASLILLSDYPCPQRNRPLPNTGIIFARPDGENITNILSEWWDFVENPSVISKSTAYEQDALIGGVLTSYRRNIALVNGEHQWYLQHDWQPTILSCDDQWICHLMHRYIDSGQEVFKRWIRQKLQLNQSSFEDTIDSISRDNTIVVPSFSLTQFLENENASVLVQSDMMAVVNTINSKLLNTRKMRKRF